MTHRKQQGALAVVASVGGSVTHFGMGHTAALQEGRVTAPRQLNPPQLTGDPHPTQCPTRRPRLHRLWRPMLLSGPREIIVAQHGHPLGLAAQSGSHLPDILLLFLKC